MPPQRPFEFRPALFNHFQRSRQNMVRANDLHAEPFHRVGEHAIDLLRRAARDARDLRTAPMMLATARLQVLENPVRTQKDRINRGSAGSVAIRVNCSIAVRT